MKFKKTFLLTITATSLLLANEGFSLTRGKYSNYNNSRSKNSSLYSNSNKIGYYGNSQYNNYYLAQYSQEDCISVLLQALDKACYNDVDISNGVYQDCAGASISDLSNFMDANLFYIIPSEQQEAYEKKCSAYKSKAIERFMSIKSNIEQNAKESSYECQRAKDLLEKAKTCHTQIIASSGSYLENGGTCSSEVRKNFQQAGNMGASNVMGYVDNFVTGQFTGKQANWRQSVDSVLSGYMMKAKGACGVDDFEITEINLYSADNQSNSASVYRNAKATQAGATGNGNYGVIGQVVNGIKEISNASGSSIDATIPQIAPSNSAGSTLDKQITGFVYNISSSNIGVATSRLSIILENPTYMDTNNPVDNEIARNIFGTTVSKSNLSSFTNHVNNMTGKTNIFIIKSNSSGMNLCSIQKQSGNRLLPIDSLTALQSSKLKVYVNNCSEITGF